MIFFLKTSGVFSSLILIIAGIQITRIEIDLDSLPDQQAAEESLFNHLGTALIGSACFTGPLLFGVANLIEEKDKNK